MSLRHIFRLPCLTVGCNHLTLHLRFTSGVLDYLMEKGVYTSHVVGVSAGACNGVDYVSRQIGRTRDCMIHKEREYCYYYGFRKFIREKSLMDMDMIFDRYPN